MVAHLSAGTVIKTLLLVSDYTPSPESFLEHWKSVRARTKRVAQIIPPERVEWTHAAGKFTLDDIVRHLGAIERYMYAENALRRPSRYPGHGRELADGREAVLAY